MKDVGRSVLNAVSKEEAGSRKSAPGFVLGIILLAALFFGLSASAGLGDAQTSDEAVHLAAGFSFLKTGDRRMNPEHPPLAKVLSAIPLLFTDAGLPLDHSSWREAREWGFGARFLYRNTLHPDTLLALGRAPIVVLGTLLIVLVGVWARRLYGPWGGLLAAAVAALEPNLLAHSHYVTNDVPVALAYVFCLYALHRFRETHSPRWRAVLGVGVGLALATKFSALLVLPIVGLGLRPGRLLPERGRRMADLRVLLLNALWVGGLAYIVLALVYRTEPIGAYLDGLGRMQDHWTSYLLGDISDNGWYHYFVVTWLLKTPPATVCLFVLALLSLRHRPLGSGEALIVIGAAWYFGVSSLMRINIGIRHILPVCALVPIFIGRLASPEIVRRLDRLWWGIPAALMLIALEVVGAHPFYLSYFTSVVGGPYEGYRYLSDSNLDWGQDFKRLARWAREERGVDTLILGTFFGGEPSAYGIRFQSLPGFGGVTYKEELPDALPDTLLVAMSAMNLQGVYLSHSNLFITRKPIDETLYRFLLERPVTRRLSPSIWVWDVSRDPDALNRLGLIYMNFNWYHAAISMFERYLALRPEDVRTRAGLDRLREELRKAEEKVRGGG